MSAFEEALRLSGEEWIASFPSDLPNHRFSKKHNKAIKDIISGKEEKRRHTLSKRTIKVLVVAAVLLAFITTVFAVPASREYIVQRFFNHSSYSVKDIDKISTVDMLEINYVPEGFVITDEYKSKYVHSAAYSNEQKYFSVDKHAINTQVNFDTEKYDCKNISINGIDGVFYETESSEKGIIFNNADYIFIVSGNIDENELINIAQNLR